MVHLERRLKLWLKGDLNTLLVEGRAIQHLLSRKRTITRTRSASMGEKARIFAKLMMEGKVKSALRMIANDECVVLYMIPRQQRQFYWLMHLSLNREVALRNIQHLCPSLSVVLINTYREDIDLFVDGATLLSTEGTTQGDPLAMAMYGIGILPLIKKLQTCDVTQTWYADDAAAAGSTANIRCWWDMITKAGPMFGYYPNASKTHLIVKQE